MTTCIRGDQRDPVVACISTGKICLVQAEGNTAVVAAPVVDLFRADDGTTIGIQCNRGGPANGNRADLIHYSDRAGTGTGIAGCILSGERCLKRTDIRAAKDHRLRLYADTAAVIAAAVIDDVVRI